MKIPYAVVFPGQGAQRIGMLSELAKSSCHVEKIFSRVSSATGEDLWNIVQNGPIEKLNDTQYTQPIMYASGIALWNEWRDLVGDCASPSVIAGHSLGEYCALTASGKLELNHGIDLVSKRGQLMAELSPRESTGMSSVIGLTSEAVKEVCDSYYGDGVVEPVNFNSDKQVVISGHRRAIDELKNLLKERGGYVVDLPVSIANHSSLLNDAAMQFEKEIDNVAFKTSSIDVVMNTTAMSTTDIPSLVAVLKRQMNSPVQWLSSYKQIVSVYKPKLTIEFGTGGVLAAICKKIAPEVPTVSIASPADFKDYGDYLRAA